MHTRLINFVAFLFCCFLIAAALYFEFHEGLEPCALCILQRLAVVTLGFIFLIATLHNPKTTTGRRVYGTLEILAALAGIAAATRQIWLEFHPPLQDTCLPSVTYMLQTLPLGETLKMLMVGGGDCALVKWRFLGLSMPMWVVISFVLLIGASLLTMAKKSKSE